VRVQEGGSEIAFVGHMFLHPAQVNRYERAELEPDPETATLMTDALDNANGTPHRIPSPGDCQSCHNSLRERVLGFGAIQLSYPAAAGFPTLTFSELASRGMITEAPEPEGYDPPGNATEQAALGYFHANCGNCHHDAGVFTQSPTMWLRLLVDQTSVADTDTYETAVGKNTGNPNFSTMYPLRIAPHHAESSSIVARMQRNPSIGETLQMPPIGRKLPDMAGIEVVSTWINSLPE